MGYDHDQRAHGIEAVRADHGSGASSVQRAKTKDLSSSVVKPIPKCSDRYSPDCATRDTTGSPLFTSMAYSTRYTLQIMKSISRSLLAVAEVENNEIGE